MRIAHVSDCYLPRLGGIEVQVHDLAQRQRSEGHDVEVITATPRRRHDHIEREVVDGVVVRRLSADLPFELPVRPGASRALRQLFASGGYDAVHVHNGVVSPFAWPAIREAVRAGLPTVVTLHCVWGRAEPAFAALDRLNHWSRWPLALTAVSEVAAEPLRRIATGAEVGILHNGVDPQRWKVNRTPGADDEVHLVAVMRLAARKRPLPLLRVFERVRALVPEGIRLRAELIGDGPLRPALERHVAARGLDTWVSLAGRLSRDEIRDRFASADAFVSPADLDSFGIAALEARCAGLPVVAKSASGVREFVTDGVEGLLAADDAELVGALVRLATDPGLRSRIARHNALTPVPMAWDRVLERTHAQYERAASLIGAPAAQ